MLENYVGQVESIGSRLATVHRAAQPVWNVASIGECTIELREAEGGGLQCAYSGDALNTAVNLARLGVSVAYVSALGGDPLSRVMPSCPSPIGAREVVNTTAAGEPAVP
jgi:sugar/nucleoside kinase (ribokinase family)